MDPPDKPEDDEELGFENDKKSENFFVKITPFRIFLFDQIDFPGA